MTVRFECLLLEPSDPEWPRIETTLLRDGHVLPLCHRVDWARVHPVPHRLAVTLVNGEPSAAFAIAARRCRALPGHEVWRADKVRMPRSSEAFAQLVGGLIEHARRRSVVRLEVGSYATSSEEAAELAAVLQRSGLVATASTESYRWTRCLDLGLCEPSLVRGMTRMGRRQLRRLEKLPLRIATIAEDLALPDLMALVAETRARTHDRRARRLDHLTSLARQRPDLIRITGLYDDHDRLLAFATGLYDGDRVTYGEGASRREAGLHVPLGYGPLWSLVQWARERGVATFDLGGVTRGAPPSESSVLEGISHFKRQLGGEERDVGRDFVRVLRPVRAHYLDWTRRIRERVLERIDE